MDDPLLHENWDLSVNPGLSQAIVKYVEKKTIHSEYLKIFTDACIPRSYVEAAHEIDRLSQRPGKGAFPRSALPGILQSVDLSNPVETNILHNILCVCSNSWHSENGNENIMKLTSGRFSKIYCYRITKNASSTLFGALQDALVGKMLRKCYLAMKYDGSQEYWGYVGSKGTVNFSSSPLGCVTKSFNFSHSHYPITNYNKYPESVYKVISIRDPLRRIVSFFNHLGREKFESMDRFVEECHPDFIFGQLYFLDQTLSLSGAKRTLRQLNRVLIVEESRNWSDQLTSDLGMHIPMTSRNVRSYSSEKQSADVLRSQLERLIARQPHLARLLEKEYKLYDFAKSL
jgi:hypothetical protein